MIESILLSDQGAVGIFASSKLIEDTSCAILFFNTHLESTLSKPDVRLVQAINLSRRITDVCRSYKNPKCIGLGDLNSRRETGVLQFLLEGLT